MTKRSNVAQTFLSVPILAALLCALLVAIVCFVMPCGKCGEFLFNALLQSGFMMSWMFAIMFLLGLFVILERLWFFVERLPFFATLIASAMRKERIFTTESREDVLDSHLDGDEPDSGAGLLDFIAGVAPVLGFVGTLIGLMAAFDRLGVGARLVSVLHALSYSMNTSLLGAAISLLFLTIAFLLRRIRTLFDWQFQQPSTKEKK